MATKTKKLSTSALKSIYSKNYTSKKIFVEAEGQTFEVLIQEKFKLSLMQNVIFDLIEAKKYLTTYDQALDFGSYYIFLIIKYFTDISIAKDCDSFEKEIEMLNIMLDLGIVEQIFKHFDEKEMQKVNECIKKMSVNSKAILTNPDLQKELVDMFSDLNEEKVESEQVNENEGETNE